MTTANELLTIPETAQELRVSRSTVYEMIASGDLERIKLRKAVRVRRESVDRVKRSGTAAD